MRKKLRILIAEDEYLCLIGLKAELNLLGHEIIAECSNGEQFIKETLEKKPDLVIADINMPVINGIAAIKEINKHIIIPSIIVTAYDDEKLIESAIEQGVFYYLIKPIDGRILKISIEITMAKYDEFKILKKELHSAKDSLEARKYIEKAKGILMRHNNISENDAFIKLQKISKDKNKKLLVVASEIIKAYETLN